MSVPILIDVVLSELIGGAFSHCGEARLTVRRRKTIGEATPPLERSMRLDALGNDQASVISF